MLYNQNPGLDSSADANHALEPTVIFMAINKTGCSTFQTILEREYGLANALQINPSKEPSHSLSFDEFKKLPEEEKKRYKSLSGHMFFYWGIHEHIPKPSTYVTFMRNPVDRTISFYYYLLQQHKHRYSKMIMSECRDLNDFVRKGYSWNNLFVKYLSSFEAEQIGPIPEGALESAKSNLRKYFTAFGITERYYESLILIKKALGWKNMPYYKKENVTKNRPSRSSIPQDSISLIEEYNQPDMEFYEYACALLEEMVDRQDGSFAGEVEEFQRQNEHLAPMLTLPRNESVMHNGVGEHLFRNGNLDEALASFNMALSLDPDSVEAHNNLGVLYFSAGDSQKALECFQNALMINYLDRDAIYNCGELFKRVGRNDDARVCYETYLQKYPGDSELRNKLEEVLVIGI